MEIEIKNLTKKYKDNIALKDINLNVEQGMFGLLGPNGAGKTTLMKILATIENKTNGEIRICGIPIENKKEIRKIIGYLPQEFSMYGNMKIYEALEYLAILSGVDNKSIDAVVSDVLRRVNLYKDRRKQIKNLSGGMKRRLGIAQAILGKPKVIIVDEPTVGLDPEERVNFRNLLCEISNEKIVILSTHIVADIEATCDKLAILDEGTICFAGSKFELINSITDSVYIMEVDTWDLASYRERYLITEMLSKGSKTVIRVVADNVSEKYIKKDSLNLEDAYMQLMKKRGVEQ